NAARGVPTINAAVIAFAATGEPSAFLDGTTITRLRTAAASALASRYLSRKKSSHLVIVGTGALAPEMAEGHCAVRPISRVSVWGRDRQKTREAARAIRQRLASKVEVIEADSLAPVVEMADVVSC